MDRKNVRGRPAPAPCETAFALQVLLQLKDDQLAGELAEGLQGRVKPGPALGLVPPTEGGDDPLAGLAAHPDGVDALQVLAYRATLLRR